MTHPVIGESHAEAFSCIDDALARHPAGRAEAPAIGAALGAAAGALARYSRAGLRALRRLQRETTTKSVYIFVSERGAPVSRCRLSADGGSGGSGGKFPFLIHSHMLRDSTGYKLANDGQDTRGVDLPNVVCCSPRRNEACAV